MWPDSYIAGDWTVTLSGTPSLTPDTAIPHRSEQLMESGVLFIELGAVVLALGLLGRFAGRIGLSPIPFYLLAGLAVGQGGLVPLDASEEFIGIGAEIGVVLLLLLLGLEYSASELTTNLRQQAPAGVMNIVANGAPGVLIGIMLR